MVPFISIFYLNFEPHLEDALLNELSAIDNIADDEDEADDQVGHQGGVAEVFRVDVGVGVAELQRGGGEVEVVAVVSVSKTNHFKLSERKSTAGGVMALQCNMHHSFESQHNKIEICLEPGN